MMLLARRNGVPSGSGSVTMPGARRAMRRSSGGPTHVTSGARAESSVVMILSLLSNVARRSAINVSQCSESSAATNARGVRATFCPAMPAVGSGAVGSGVGVCEAFFGPHATAARTTKYLAFKRLFTRRNLSQRQSAVHHNHLSGDMSRCFAAQEDDHARNVFRFRNASEYRLMLSTLQDFARQLRQQLRF